MVRANQGTIVQCPGAVPDRHGITARATLSYVTSMGIWVTDAKEEEKRLCVVFLTSTTIWSKAKENPTLASGATRALRRFPFVSDI
ncbi:hypothetical protein PspLS_07415 [Pyricularia sp. CBS 133598]|nr:hypothetical protein PspLS_07415 [Pyricularia sp. CBS 133598]